MYVWNAICKQIIVKQNKFNVNRISTIFAYMFKDFVTPRPAPSQKKEKKKLAQDIAKCYIT